MKICLYSPYVPKHFGGGEKYFFDVAKTFRDLGHQVQVAIPSGSVEPAAYDEAREKYEVFLDTSLEGIEFIKSPLGPSKGFMKKAIWTERFDLLYYITDGSIFWSFAKNNVLHVQTPVKRGALSLHEKLKFTRWNFVNTNSAFTKRVVEENWGIKVNAVHNPSVEVEEISNLSKSQEKQKTILHVGRFFKQLHSKRQDILVKFFANLLKKYPEIMKGWKLVLVGSIEDGVENIAYAEKVKELAKGLPIEILHEVNRQDLKKKYGQASIYWHATGFGVDEQKNPEKTEHFGISTVEAMSAGAVPIVIKKGGQPEVLGSELLDLSWETEKACLEITTKLIENDEVRKSWSKKAQKRAEKFNQPSFKKNIEEMLSQLK